MDEEDFFEPAPFLFFSFVSEVADAIDSPPPSFASANRALNTVSATLCEEETDKEEEEVDNTAADDEDDDEFEMKEEEEDVAGAVLVELGRRLNLYMIRREAIDDALFSSYDKLTSPITPPVAFGTEEFTLE